MKRAEQQEQIEAFWEWFSLNQTRIETIIGTSDHHPETEWLIESLDRYILAFGKLKWEVANLSSGLFTFTLSPNNDADLLAMARSIISTAPNLGQWQFVAGKPATGKLAVRLYNAEMDICEVDAQAWLVALLPTGDGRFDLLIEADNTGHLDEDTELIAVDLILNELLGEAAKIECLAGFEIDAERDPDHYDDYFPISALSFSLLS